MLQPDQEQVALAIRGTYDSWALGFGRSAIESCAHNIADALQQRHLSGFDKQEFLAIAIGNVRKSIPVAPYAPERLGDQEVDQLT